jgi:transposase InsO family protein
LITPTAPLFAHLYADFASLLDGTSADGTVVYNGVLLIVDAKSRFTLVFPVSRFTGETAIAGYITWRRFFGPPAKFSTDGGSHFNNAALRKILDSDGAELDVGTPHHSRGRGIVERRVKIVKQLLRKILPPGKVDKWVVTLDELQHLLNCLPSRAIGGISPYEYVFGVKPQRRLRLDYFDSSPLASAQSAEDRLLLLSSLRWLADACSGTLGYLRAADSAEQYADVSFSVGDSVALHYDTLENALGNYYRGPFRVTNRDGDFYVVNEILAHDALGKSVRTHVSRLLRYDMSRTTPDQIHQAKLPEGFYVVKDVLDGPRDDGRFQVSWLHTDALTWEPSSALLGVAPYAKYCTARGIDLFGRPLQAASSELEQGNDSPVSSRPRRACTTARGRWASTSCP